MKSCLMKANLSNLVSKLYYSYAALRLQAGKSLMTLLVDL